MGTIRDILGMPDDDLAAAGDDLRDALHWETLIDRDLIVTEVTDTEHPIPYPPRKEHLA
jgi:hypothetical protein